MVRRKKEEEDVSIKISSSSSYIGNLQNDSSS
jgi:hypothetical protein